MMKKNSSCYWKISKKESTDEEGCSDETDDVPFKAQSVKMTISILRRKCFL